jgi:hypothetical protein
VKKTSKANVGLREVQVLTALDFALACHHPFVPTRSALKDAIRKFFVDSGTDSPAATEVSVKKWNELQQLAMSVVEISLASDLAFVYPPAVIALGALMFVGTSASLAKLKPLAKFWPDSAIVADAEIKAFLVRWINEYCQGNNLAASDAISTVTSVLETVIANLAKLVERESKSALSDGAYLSDPLFHHLEQVVASKWTDANAAVIQAGVKEKASYKIEKGKQ